MNVKARVNAPDGDGAVLEAIVLAAGRASRFGGAKLLAPWADGVLLDGALAAAMAAPARRVTLVTGCDGEAVAAAARAWVDRVGADRVGGADRLRCVAAADWREGLSASLKAGVAALGPDVAGCYVFLGDMPRVPEVVLAPLAQALRAGAPAAVPTHGGVAGHPALIGAALFDQIAGLSGDRGARAVLERLGTALARIETDDDGVLFDVDTPDALQHGVLQPAVEFKG